MPPLDQIEVFLRVVERGSFTGAAKQLQLPLSVVSRKIKALEQSLGVQLLHRTTRRVTVTESGQAFYERCVDAVQALSNAEAAVRALAEEPEGRLRILAPHAFGLLIIEPMLGDFRRRYPKVDLTLVLDNEPRDLLEGGFDIAVRASPAVDSSYVVRRLATTCSSLVASPAFLDRVGRPNHPAELEAMPLIQIANHQGPLHWTLVGPEGSYDLRQPAALTTNDVVLAARQAARGEGVALLSTGFTRSRVRSGELELILPEWRSARLLEMVALFPRRATLDLKVRVFVDFLVEAVRNWTAGPVRPKLPAEPFLPLATPLPGTHTDGAPYPILQQMPRGDSKTAAAQGI